MSNKLYVTNTEIFKICKLILSLPETLRLKIEHLNKYKYDQWIKLKTLWPGRKNSPFATLFSKQSVCRKLINNVCLSWYAQP